VKESAYLLNFGYQGIMSTIDAFVQNDVIVYDVDAHACIIDEFVCTWKVLHTTHDPASMEKTCNVLQN
jgi:glycine C-acetyltransferase